MHCYQNFWIGVVLVMARIMVARLTAGSALYPAENSIQTERFVEGEGGS